VTDMQKATNQKTKTPKTTKKPIEDKVDNKKG
jgi:hypothetical protein